MRGNRSKKRIMKSQQTFILEPILTRSGLIEGTDDTADSEVHLDGFYHSPIELLDTDKLGNVDSIDSDTSDVVTADIDPIITHDTVDTPLLNDQTEEIPFITSIDQIKDDHLTDKTLEIISQTDNAVEELTVQAHEGSGEQLVLRELVDPISPRFKSGVFTVSNTGKVSVDFVFDGGGYKGELAIFSLEGMNEFELGSQEFIKEAASRALSHSELGHVVISDPTEGAAFSGFLGEGNHNSGDYLGVKTFDMRPGDTFGVMLIPNGRVQQVFDNPAMGGAVRPLFSLATANPEDAFHVGQIADVTGDSHTFVMEDLRVDSWTDKDYNDIIFQVTGATGKAVHLDEVINPNHDWRITELGKTILNYAELANQPDLTLEIPDSGTIEVVDPIEDFTLTPEHPTTTIDLSEVFADRNNSSLQFDIVDGNGDAVAIALDGTQLNLTALPETDVTTVAIRAINEAGNSLTQSFSVTTSHLSQESTQILNGSLSELQAVIHDNSGDLIAGLNTLEGESVIAQLETLVEQNPSLLHLLTKPESFSQLGIIPENAATLHQLLESPELATEMGLPVSLREALSQPDQGMMDIFLTNAQDAIALLPSDTHQPPVGFIDFTQGQHIQHVTDIFASVNPIANYQTFPITPGNWAAQVVQFVNQIKESGTNHGILNLSFDLSQIDDIGYTTRYEFTPEEQSAIQYARDNNILLIVAAGNTGGKMSALGAASQEFDNIITVGAVNQFESKTDYSAYGNGLNLMAPGGTWHDDPNAFAGTSKATSYVTAAASLVWAANSELSYQQVKQLLLETAVDLNTPGWDEKTGAGLVDIKEAISRAQLIEPKTTIPTPHSLPTSFSGEGRVLTLARPTSDATETAINTLEDTQQNLLDQWQVLADLGNPDLTLTELDSEVKQKIAEAFANYQQVSTQAEITIAQAQQWTEALALATSHYQIEQSRLQALLEHKQEIENYLAGLGEQKAHLQTETRQLLNNIKQQITQAEADLAKAKAKLLNPFADADDHLQTNPKPWQQAANSEAQTALNFQEQAAIQAAEAERYNAIANSINPNRWQVIGTERDRSGRTKEIWGWGTDPQLVKQQNQALWQAQIAAKNPPILNQLSQQSKQQNNNLNQYAEFIQNRKDHLDIGDANIDDVANIVEFLQQQATEQEKIADKYARLTAIAEARRQENQTLADWHNSQINRWEVIGTRRKRSGKTENVYGWVHYPEHITPRDQAQQLANQAAQEKQAYQQLALQARQQTDALNEQLRKLQERMRDWQVLKQGIEYEIAANQLRLQAENDLLAMHEPVQQQALETLNLQIQQTESELNKLLNETLPTQQQLADATAERLQDTQSKWQASQQEREAAQDELQTVLELSGFLLPYRERLTLIQQQKQQLESERLDVRLTRQELANQLTQTPSDSLSQQLNDWSNYLKKLNQKLAWVRIQNDQLALAVADSPERLAIAALIRELEPLATDVLTDVTDVSGFNPKSKIQNLKSIEGSGANFLSGFDNLTQRLNQAEIEANKTAQSLATLQQEYRNLGLVKANSEQQLIDKYRQIELTEKYLAQINAEVNRLQSRLDLLNQAGILEQNYQDHWEEWQQARQSQMTATNALLTTREAGASDRNLLANLQSQLSQVNATLNQAKTLQQSITDTQQALDFTKLQLQNQNLLLTSLIERDAPLASQEAYYLSQAQTHLQKMWYWNGKDYTYNTTEAAAYRANLQQASFIADQRNQLWQQRQQTQTRIHELSQQITEQKSQLHTLQSQFAALGEVAQIEAQLTTLQRKINTVSQRLEPLQVQENQQVQSFKNAVKNAENLRTELVHTTELQSKALEQLIGFGILASESDVDFFATQVEPQVNNYIEQLRARVQTLGEIVQETSKQIANWQQQLGNTTDEVSKQALTNAINQSQAQLTNLDDLRTYSRTETDELEELLNQAITALIPLRQQQELEIRKTLESNQTRLETLQSQLNSENAAEVAIKDDTVLAYAELNDQVRQDLTNGVSNWTQALLDGHQMTKDLGNSQQQLSQSVDELIADITQNFAEPNAEYNQSVTALRDGINTLGVVENRADELDSSVTSTEDAIARLKLRLEQDAQLWEEIAPIAIRYGVESQELREYKARLAEIQAIKDQKLVQVQSLREQAASLDQQAENAYNRSHKQGPTWTERRWVKGRKGGGHWETITHPDPEYIQYQKLSQRATNRRQQADTIEKQAEEDAQNARKLLRSRFVKTHPENGTAIDLLQYATLQGSHSNQRISRLINATQPEVLLNAAAVAGRNPNQALLDKVKAAQAEHEAQGYAALSQADSYEQQAAYHWARSHKNGPYWYEQRWVKGRSARKGHWETITHVDQDWILWNTYHNQTAPQLRQQGQYHLGEAEKWRKEKERLEPLVQQWTAANEAANLAEPPIDEARELFAQLEVARESIPGEKAQLASLENLLLIIQQQLEAAQKEADSQNAKVRAQWQEYDSNSEEYRDAIADLLQRRGELNRNSLELQQQIAESEKWVEQQSVALSTELEGAKALIANLENQRQVIANQIRHLTQQGVTVDGLEDLYTKDAQLEQSLQLLTNKVTILTAQQTALTQKRTLLTAQNEVILAEQKLLDAYIQDPDADYSTLQQQLQDTRAALAEAQRLAEQAEAASQALTAPLQQIQTELLAQNDEHLQAAKAHQQVLKALVEATQLNANYTLQAAQKQQEVNSLEFQIIQRLQEATAAGSQEAKHLLDVAKYNDMATVAEIYYRDYKDLASDRGGCAGGAGRAEDRVLADQYYQEMLENRELQRRAKVQAEAFKQVKDTAQNQIKALQSQQEIAAQLLNELNAKVAETQAEREQKEQELAIAQVRLDGITRIREQTEQTFTQLVTLEKLNLAQAQLEQEIAQARQVEIEEAVQERMERDRLKVERQRLETTAKIEQLRQLQAEDEWLRSLNQVRGDLGLATLDSREDSVQLATQMASLLASLQELETQNPELPDDVKALLAEARGDIHLALQGKVQEVSQDNLISAMNTLILQGNQYKTEIDRIAQEDQEDLELLQKADQDLQQATQEFLAEIDEAQLLKEEREILTPLAIESLTKVAYANQAVEISEELAKAAQDVLKQILDYRKKQREARKKAFWGKILNIAKTVLSVISLIVKPLAPLVALAVNLVNSIVGAIWSAINGDWLGAIFTGVMSAANFISAGLSQIIQKAGNCICVFGTAIAKSTLENIKKGIDVLKNLAYGAYKGAKSIMSGDAIKGVLQILSGLASTIDAQLGDWIKNLPFGDKIFGVVKIIGSTPVAILDAVRAIESGDWFTGVNSLIAQVLSIGSNLTGGVGKTIFGLFDNINTTVGAVVNNFIRGDGLKDWLNGIGEIAGAWKDLPNLIQGGIDEIKKDNCITGMEQIISNVLNSVKTFADNVENGANAVENVTYTSLALITVIEGGTKGLKDLFNSSKEALGYLKKGWSDDIKKQELDKVFEKLGKDLGADLKGANGLDEKFDSLVNWVKTKVSSELSQRVIDLLNTLNPKTWNPKPLTP